MNLLLSVVLLSISCIAAQTVTGPLMIPAHLEPNQVIYIQGTGFANGMTTQVGGVNVAGGYLVNSQTIAVYYSDLSGPPRGTSICVGSACLSVTVIALFQPSWIPAIPIGGSFLLQGWSFLDLNSIRFPNETSMLRINGVPATSTYITSDIPSQAYITYPRITNTPVILSFLAGGIVFQTSPVPVVSITGPTSLPVNKGVVTITGRNFVDPMPTTINGIACTGGYLLSSTQIVCSFNAITTSPVTITVANTKLEGVIVPICNCANNAVCKFVNSVPTCDCTTAYDSYANNCGPPFVGATCAKRQCACTSTPSNPMYSNGCSEQPTYTVYTPGPFPSDTRACMSGICSQLKAFAGWSHLTNACSMSCSK